MQDEEQARRRAEEERIERHAPSLCYLNIYVYLYNNLIMCLLGRRCASDSRRRRSVANSRRRGGRWTKSALRWRRRRRTSARRRRSMTSRPSSYLIFLFLSSSPLFTVTSSPAYFQLLLLLLLIFFHLVRVIAMALSRLRQSLVAASSAPPPLLALIPILPWYHLFIYSCYISSYTFLSIAMFPCVLFADDHCDGEGDDDGRVWQSCPCPCHPCRPCPCARSEDWYASFLNHIIYDIYILVWQE